MLKHKTVKSESKIEIVINKSRFIGHCFPILDEDEAAGILARLRKEYWDASHKCYAYVLGETGMLARFSDDGEPGGTAGMPILDVIRKKGLTYTLIVVTRYFGGILLGAGGLVRAYSNSAARAAEAAGMVSVEPAFEIELVVDYSRYGAVEGFVRENSQVSSTEFTDAVTMRVMLPETAAEGFIAEIVERTDGRVRPVISGSGSIKRVLDSGLA